MMPFQTILYYYHLLYNILFFNIIGSSPFPSYCSKDQRADQTRQAAVCLFLLLHTRTYMNIAILRLFQQFLYYSRSLSILFSRPEMQAPFLLLCIHLFSSKMGTGRTHTHRLQSMLHNKKSEIFRKIVIDEKTNSWDLLMKRANNLDLFTKSLPQWLLKCQTSLSPANK